MLLFSAIDRSDASPKRNSEPLFDFYNRAARPEFAEYRSIVEAWLAEMRPDDAAELAAQMRSHDDEKYESGLIELVMHASLIRLGHTVEVHPALVGNQNRPDFLLRGAAGEALAYVEVTTINPARPDVSDERREALIRDRLDQVKLPDDMRLSYHVEKAGSDSPSLSRLVAEVEIWARNNAEAARAGNGAEKVFTAGDWEIGLRLVHGFRPRPGGRQIAFAMDRITSMDMAEPAEALMSALARKATRYGNLALPYVIVVADRTERLGRFAGDLAANVAGGLFGPEIIEDVEYRDGSRRMRRRRSDGFWLRQGRPRQTGVSAVLVFPRADLWKLREERWQPLLVRNTFADRPLPEAIQMPWHNLEMTEDEGIVRPGRLAGDILGLPVPWPPEH